MNGSMDSVRILGTSVGRFFFRYRDVVFPVMVVALFSFAAPPDTLFESARLEHLKDAAACAIAALGISIRLVAVSYARVRHAGKKKQVYADNLVTNGVFGLSRNPLYVGNLLICLGVFLAHGNIYVVLIGTITFALIYICIVSAEEEFLRTAFGSAYRAYCAAVPRWIPRLSDFRSAVGEAPFDLRRGLLREYGIIAMVISCVALTEFYEELMEPGSVQGMWSQFVLAGIVATCAVSSVTIRRLKQRGAFKSS